MCDPRILQVGHSGGQGGMVSRGGAGGGEEGVDK